MGTRPERPPVPAAGPVAGPGRGDPGPAHAEVVVGEAGDRVRELHGRAVVSLEQGAPPEGRERVGQIAYRQVAAAGQVDSVHRAGQPDQVVRAAGQGRGLGGVDRAVRVDAAESFAVDRGTTGPGVTLHPVAGGEQLPADPAETGHVAVEGLLAHQRPLGRLHEGVEHGPGHVRLVAPGAGQRGANRAGRGASRAGPAGLPERTGPGPRRNGSPARSEPPARS